MWGAFWEIEDEVKVQERGESVTINVQNHTITIVIECYWNTNDNWCFSF